MKNLYYYLLKQATSFRCGITMPFQEVIPNFSDIGGIYNISVPRDSAKNWATSSGCIDFDKENAICGAIAEAMERYCGALISFQIKNKAELKGKSVIQLEKFALFSDEQYSNPEFIWKKPVDDGVFYGKMYSVYDNEEVWIPHELIGLGTKTSKAAVPSTSTGIASHTDKWLALLRAIQEILERDAFTVYWVNSLPGREIKLDDRYLKPVKEKHGEIFCFDITQDWNPNPVVAICGFIKQRNLKRISMGVACRSNYEDAIKKAYLEWVQGTIFAVYYKMSMPNIRLGNPSQISDFDEHAAYYTIHPEKWECVPIIKNRKGFDRGGIFRSLRKNEPDNPKTILKNLLKAIIKEKIEIFYKDITLPDVRQTGLWVIRAVSPQLSLIHGDESAAFLGGRTGDVKWRYKELYKSNKTGMDFPNKFPHPLG